MLADILDEFRVQLTIITKQELVVTGTEHAHGATALTSLSQLLKSRVIPLRNRDTLETVGHVKLSENGKRAVVRTR